MSGRFESSARSIRRSSQDTASGLPPRSLTKTICLPVFGFHAGEVFTPAAKVIRCSAPPSAFGHVDFGIAIPAGHERDLRAVRRPCRRAVRSPESRKRNQPVRCRRIHANLRRRDSAIRHVARECDARRHPATSGESARWISDASVDADSRRRNPCPRFPCCPISSSHRRFASARCRVSSAQDARRCRRRIDAPAFGRPSSVAAPR